MAGKEFGLEEPTPVSQGHSQTTPETLGIPPVAWKRAPGFEHSGRPMSHVPQEDRTSGCQGEDMLTPDKMDVFFFGSCFFVVSHGSHRACADSVCWLINMDSVISTCFSLALPPVRSISFHLSPVCALLVACIRVTFPRVHF